MSGLDGCDDDIAGFCTTVEIPVAPCKNSDLVTLASPIAANNELAGRRAIKASHLARSLAYKRACYLWT